MNNFIYVKIMFSRLNNLIGISSILPKHLLSKSLEPSDKPTRYIKICLSFPFFLYSQNALCASLPIKTIPHSSQIANLSSPSTSSFLQILTRFFHLILIFSPSLLTLPFALIPPLQKLWIKVFVWSVERAGVVWIKLFQYLSHRGDVIG